jgi:hypothetical protein
MGEQYSNGSKEIKCEGMKWIQLARDGDLWRAIATVVINVWSPYKEAIS